MFWRLSVLSEREAGPGGFAKGLTEEDIRRLGAVGIGRLDEKFTELVVAGRCVGLVYCDEADGFVSLTVYDGVHLNELTIMTDNELRVSRPEGLRRYSKEVN